MRCDQHSITFEPEDLTFIYQTSTEVAQDETTEQVFSRKERKAYRQLWDREAIKQRTETKRGNTKRKASTLGEKGSPKAKARRTA